MLRSVPPTEISRFRGTTVVSTAVLDRRTNLTWLPFWLASMKPAASRRRLMSRKGWGLSCPNLYLDHLNGGCAGGMRWFEVELERFLQVGQRLFFSFALACDVDLEALGDVPVSLSPNTCCEGALHESIFSQTGRLWRAFDRWPSHGQTARFAEGQKVTFTR
jgi:hypothetical protein